jgi:S-adenosylmethionine:tRNA ribosyltransferase-isomerase
MSEGGAASMDAFDYELPAGRIAQYPARHREESRLLIVDRQAGSWRDAEFPQLVEALAPGDVLVLNDTRVFPARLFARRSSGTRVELLLSRPLDDTDPERASGRVWEALTRPAKKARPGERLALLSHDGQPAPGAWVEITGVREGSGMRAVELDVPTPTWKWISEHGHVPLPPYIDRDDESSDRERYQTVYAAHRGAIAAPTAGLHFTPELLSRLEERDIEQVMLTLHVGPGTFRPVTTERAEDHTMDAEWFDVPEATADAVARARQRGNRVVAVGTTTVRALESSTRQGWTDLYIRPGHEFGCVDALVTNFHLPRSTLLLLVAAFAGTELILDAYRHAVDSGYRFYSYGDAMLIV